MVGCGYLGAVHATAMASIGHEVQPILFTHHEQVASLARARLGDAVDVIELG